MAEANERRRLTLRFDPDADRPDYPVVSILIDGEDLVAGTPQANFMGFDPAEILGTDSPLLPTTSPRRVAVYRCSCGEAGCGCIAPVISREGSDVVWRDARDFTGVFVGPTIDRDVPDGGSPLPIPTLRFDAVGYEAEVRRAMGDQSWETERRATARLLGDYLQDERDFLRARGFVFQWAAPGWQEPETFEVSLLDPERFQVVVRLRAAEAEPSVWASTLADRLLGTEPHHWEVSMRGNFAWPGNFADELRTDPDQ